MQAPDPKPLRLLEQHWLAIRDEALAMRGEMFPWRNLEIYSSGWFTGPFYSHTRAVRGRFRRECPVTVGLLDQLMADGELGLVSAGFSCIAPHSATHLHRNDDGYAWRVHLGLRIPEGDVGLTVDGAVHRWQEGRSLIWDPTLPHKAWNHTDHDRHLLLLDFFRPEHPREEMIAMMHRITAAQSKTSAGFTGLRLPDEDAG
ncbi:MAG: aspartyl/asparaginyl beta-hydroxylase (cupin superfamily) [Myxococcota bacterium]|jgi:aspartyl/asparaginyl beta-hydroxylase (cupin superfamily)